MSIDVEDRAIVEAGSSLAIPGTLTATGLTLPEDLGYDDWLRVGDVLKRMEKSVQWWIGDWLRFGERKWGEMYSQALEATDYSYGTLANMKYVAEKVDSSLRNENLSWDHHRQVASLGSGLQAELLDRAAEEHLTTRELREQVYHVKNVMGMDDAPVDKPHVAFNSGNNEWYTPLQYILAARRVMGDIDLDPASSEKANQTVGAASFYTAEQDGLRFDWYGRVWMNPPYAGELIGGFCSKLVRHYLAGDIDAAVVLVNNATETSWFQPMLRACSAVCFLRGRVKFVDMAGNPSGAPLQGQAILYFGSQPSAFVAEFSLFGEACEWKSRAA